MSGLRQRLSELVYVGEQHFNLLRYGLGYYNFWELGSVRDSWFYRFLQRPAVRDVARNQRLGIFSVFGPRHLVSSTTATRRLFFTGENLERFPAYSDHLLGEVDLALGFDEIDHPRYLRFPLWLIECFEPEATLADLERKIAAAYLTRKQNFALGATPAASLVARHDSKGIRQSMAELFEEIGPVVYGGKFGQEQGPPILEGWDAKLAFLRQFRFNICPENSDRSGYVTEKLFHAIEAGCIPIYWGSQNQPEPEIVNREAILLYDPCNPQDLQHHLRELTERPAAALKFQQRPPYLPTAATRIYRFYTDLEEALQQLFR